MMTGILAFLVDCIIGDPKSRCHPVVLMGNLISLLERLFYHPTDKGTGAYGGAGMLLKLPGPDRDEQPGWLFKLERHMDVPSKSGPGRLRSVNAASSELPGDGIRDRDLYPR